MKLAYLMNSYPMTSTTFIRREIEAIEALGRPVIRFAVRHWETQLVDPADIAEQERTEYLLTGNALGLLRAALIEVLTNLPALIRALPLWLALLRAAGGGVVRHVAYLLQAMLFRQRAAALGIGHVHVHFSTNATSVAMLARRLGGPRYSFTVHGPDELIDPASLYLGGKVAEAACVIAITDYCRGRIAAEAAPDQAGKIRIIPCGIDLGDFAFGKAPPESTGRIVCVGRLCDNKGQVFIPGAVAMLRDEFPALRIDLVGDGEARAVVEQAIARHGVSDRVTIAGWQSNEEVRKRIAASHALLLPSFAEGLPIVLMEALAIGRPVLTTRIAGIPELVDAGCGWLFAPGSEREMADAIRAALSASPEQIEAMRIEGRARIEQRHDVNKSAAALLAAFGGNSV